VVSVDGAAVTDWDAIRARVTARAGSTVPIVVERDGETVQVSPTVGNDGRIGIRPLAERHPIGMGAALGKGVTIPLRIWAETLASLGPKAEVVGPVGVVRQTAKLDKEGDPVATALSFAGALAAYCIWAPVALAIAFFPRRRRAS
jgi:hypothetical protein